MNVLHPESAEELASIAEGFYKDHTRFQTVYQPDEPADTTVNTVVLEGIARFPQLDMANGLLSFDAGAPVRMVLSCLKESPYLTEPFVRLQQDRSIGYYFTHTPLFSSDTLAAMTWVQPDGKLVGMGRKAYASVVGVRAIDLFLGSRNVLGIPVHFVYKLQPATLPLPMQEALYGKSDPLGPPQGEDRRLLVRLKTAYDPYHILNTFNL